jgi:hypothetical protein
VPDEGAYGARIARLEFAIGALPFLAERARIWDERERKMSEFACPNGHAFPAAVEVDCSECDARVLCVPWADAKRLHEALESAEREAERLRAELEQANIARDVARRLKRERDSARAEVERLRREVG